MSDNLEETNVQRLISMVNLLLAGDGVRKVKDADGKEVNQSYTVYDEKRVRLALEMSLSAFNSVPEFTCFRLSDSDVMEFSNMLTLYAAYVLIFGQSFLEKGREMSFKDSGISVTPPPLGNFTQNAAFELHRQWWEAVYSLKTSKLFLKKFCPDISPYD